MWINNVCCGVFLFACSTVELSAETPLSAIDWLSDSLAEPVQPTVTAPADDTKISENALPEAISVVALGIPTPDAVGILPTSVTGLPADLWGASTSTEIARRIQDVQFDMLPAMQDLLHTMLLAELDPPSDSDQSSILFLARIDTLLTLGALDQAIALMERAGLDNPDIFRRYFDATLLIGSEDQACNKLRATPALSPTFPARIFCLARGGDWNAASLTLDTAIALNFVSDEDANLLARFLDSTLADELPPLPVPSRPSPLVFRMMEAIGEALPTAKLPLAFANADIHANSGWKPQIEAAERLARTGAIDPNLLLGFYTARLAAASGGVWDRVEAIQKFDAAMSTKDPGAVTAALPAAWAAMKSAELEVPFARIYAEQLSRLPLGDTIKPTALQIELLSEHYETAAEKNPNNTSRDMMLNGIAKGSVGPVPASDRLAGAIRTGFATDGIPVRLQSLVDNDRLGEAILRSIELFTDGSRGDYDELSDALAFFRAVGLEDTARRASLQLLLLERRG